MIGRLLYSAAWYLAAPLIFLRLAWRARRQPEYLHNLRAVSYTHLTLPTICSV